jgi:transposase
MEQKSKFISGLEDSKIIRKTSLHFTESEKHEIIQEYLTSKCTKQSIWEKYTGYSKEHGSLLRWMQQLGYSNELITISPNFATNQIVMSNKKKSLQSNDSENASFENLQLRKRIAELEAQLKDAEMKAIAFSTMVDIAEKEFKIPIRKKLNTKPSKQ